VPDLEAASTFLVEILGCEYMYSLGPFVRDDDWMSTNLGVHPLAVMRELRFFRCGGDAVFEVFQYEAPDQSVQLPRNSDIGGHHVALYVDDLDAAIHHLRSHGVTIFGEPTASSGCSSSWSPTQLASPSTSAHGRHLPGEGETTGEPGPKSPCNRLPAASAVTAMTSDTLGGVLEVV